MKDLAAIWERVAPGHEWATELADDAMIAEAETVLGYQLPAAYVHLLKTSQNGGYLRYRLEGTRHCMIYGIGSPFGSLTDNDFLKTAPDGLVAIDADMYWTLCLDYRVNPEEPAVVMIDHGRERLVAYNFDAYLSMLKIDTDEMMVWEAHLPVADAVRQFRSLTGRVFDDKYEENGFTFYKSRFGSPPYYGKVVLSVNEGQYPEIDQAFVLLHYDLHSRNGGYITKLLREGGQVLNLLTHYFE